MMIPADTCQTKSPVSVFIMRTFTLYGAHA